MKKVTFTLIATVFSAVMFLGSLSQPVAASFNDGILTDTTKKEKKQVVKSESAPAEQTIDSTKIK